MRIQRKGQKKKTESERTRISKDSEKKLRPDTEKGHLFHSTTNTIFISEIASSPSTFFSLFQAGFGRLKYVTYLSREMISPRNRSKDALSSSNVVPLKNT